ncbi:MAG TPA: NUDIX hydrolase [Haliangiales bacterium]|nr:NUDIX hydrolase [Haliangiales bacterium]
MGQETQRSAGGVLWRRSDGTVEVCLIATRGRTRWQLPKGHPAPGETEAEAARREVREETGCDGTIEDPGRDDLGEIVFWFFIGAGAKRRRVKKSVRFFLLRYAGGDTRDHDSEVDDARWLRADVALRQLTFDSERGVLARALDRLQASAPQEGA